MTDLALRVLGLGKRYRLGPADRSAGFRTLRESLMHLGSRVVRPRSRGDARVLWALKDVSFEVRVGEAVGIIGHNGAGKSTLLKILSRITEPTTGEAEIRGRVGSLLEVGTGFHPELTGRENVYLNGAILGMRRAEIARKFDEIVAFAETEAFLDTPVKFYSNGMYARLAFAVAAHLEPDTLVVDELLALGDAAFQKKSLGKMSAVARQGRTVLFVSHNMGAVRTLCTRALVMSSGGVQFDGRAEDAISHYLAQAARTSGRDGGELSFGPKGLEFEDLRLHQLRLLDDLGRARGLFDGADRICVEIEYEVTKLLHGARTVLMVSTQEGEIAFLSTDHLARDPHQPPGRYRTSCFIPGKLLNSRMYVVGLSFDVPGVKTLAPLRQYASFTIADGIGHRGSNYPEPWPGVVCPSLEWTTERL
jgi:lipopolysaccharide transport system ATP-binding protein